MPIRFRLACSCLILVLFSLTACASAPTPTPTPLPTLTPAPTATALPSSTLTRLQVLLARPRPRNDDARAHGDPDKPAFANQTADSDPTLALRYSAVKLREPQNGRSIEAKSFNFEWETANLQEGDHYEVFIKSRRTPLG